MADKCRLPPLGRADSGDSTLSILSSTSSRSSSSSSDHFSSSSDSSLKDTTYDLYRRASFASTCASSWLEDEVHIDPTSQKQFICQSPPAEDRNDTTNTALKFEDNDTHLDVRTPTVELPGFSTLVTPSAIDSSVPKLSTSASLSSSNDATIIDQMRAIRVSDMTPRPSYISGSAYRPAMMLASSSSEFTNAKTTLPHHHHTHHAKRTSTNDASNLTRSTSTSDTNDAMSAPLRYSLRSANSEDKLSIPLSSTSSVSSPTASNSFSLAPRGSCTRVFSYPTAFPAGSSNSPYIRKQMASATSSTRHSTSFAAVPVAASVAPASHAMDRGSLSSCSVGMWKTKQWIRDSISSDIIPPSLSSSYIASPDLSHPYSMSHVHDVSATTSSSPAVSPALSHTSTDSLSSTFSSAAEAAGPAVMTPMEPCDIPFLPKDTCPPGCSITLDASHSDRWDIQVILPGFDVANITLAIKRNGALYLLAARYDDGSTSSAISDASQATQTTLAAPGLSKSSQPSTSAGCESLYPSSICPASASAFPPVTTSRRDSAAREVLKSGGSGHFERLVELGESAKGAKIKAIYDGRALSITVTKKGR